MSRAKLRAIAGVVGGVALALAAIFWVQAGSSTSLGDDLCLFQLACHLGQTDKPLANDAYIWQRKWTPAVSDAITQSSSFVDGWRVLGAETDEDGRVEARFPDWTTLNQSGKPVILVIRIDGQMVHWDEEALLSDVTTVLSQWQKRAKFLTGLEIDHDSATAQLLEYSRFLKRLRAKLDGALRLSITTLPAWLDSPDLSAVLEPIDEAVLQLHAVQAPQAGLFDRRVAIQWIDRLSAHTSKSFRHLHSPTSTSSFHGKSGAVAAQTTTPCNTRCFSTLGAAQLGLHAHRRLREGADQTLLRSPVL